MIAPDIIEQVRQSSDIVQIIGEYLKLKKRGSRFLALCPFHTEKTPSFSISPDRQLYYCFGCGRGGTVFTFLQEHEGMSFVEAVRLLAGRANITIVEDAGADHRREKSEKIAYANQVAWDFFRKLLKSSKYRYIYDSYLLGKRGLTEEAIETFGLGLAGEEWDGLIKFARDKDLSPEDLVECGLAMKSEKKGTFYDRFRHRLMIPIINLSAKPIAFGGRTLKKGEPAKYVNSPETALYLKGSVLYGLNVAKDDIRKAGYGFVVEGYFDVISLWQAGIRNVVASSGTAFTLQQARLLGRFTEEVYLFFDADSAGRRAAMRSVDVLFDAALEVKVIAAPQGEDPDSIARNDGREPIDKLREEAMDYISFRVKDIDLSDAGIITREKLVKELGALGNRISDATRRSLFISESAHALGVDTSLVRNVKAEPLSSSDPPSAKPKTFSKVESELLSLLFSNPGDIDRVFEEIAPDDFDSRELARLYSAIAQQYRDLGEVDAGALVDTVQDADFRSTISSIAAMEWEATSIDRELHRHMDRFREAKRKKIRQRLRDELRQAQSVGDKETEQRLVDELEQLGLRFKGRGE